MILHLNNFWLGALLGGPALYLGGLYILHNLILALKWLVRAARGSRPSQWLYLWAICWALPKLSKDFCHFKVFEDKMWFSPRLEKFALFSTPAEKE